MIIVCSGPDTYRAREKARELMNAFRAKHDSHGFSMETVDGTEGVIGLLSRMGGASLFSQKKMIRADGCLTKLKIADVRSLAGRLEMDKDQTILITVEEEAPTIKTLEALRIAPLFHYSFPTQTGSAFRSWVRDVAAKQGVSASIADQIANQTEGDSWQAFQEIAKQVANPHAIESSGVHGIGSIFEIADAVLAHRPGWREALANAEDENAMSICLSQTRSYLRVRDGSIEGLHPYVAKKLGSLRTTNPEERLQDLLRALYSSRTGMGNSEEAETLLH